MANLVNDQNDPVSEAPGGRIGLPRGGVTSELACPEGRPGRSAVACVLFIIALVFIVPVQDGSIAADAGEGLVVGLAFETAAIIELANVIAVLLARRPRFTRTP